ncbi:MAG: cytochrome c-type biogenesis protein [Yersiniaceae bacterium]|uniref:Cytochrome c-type biogenesis protein n=1 Tax=Chimaeribacter coloradensis TaxID=2060068 RepID=A0A2N5E1U7_9GAMM|nr:cytochrome c-type biogenesis protein [Chimaeribacter coloradensis]MDU6410601.1 cytochrome c-type biogenesis protein [Yersiniaceae bacterium]PLR34401.1 cytochrome c-type biogenesis protein CcmH [Chimaeribacter coloradensis]
MRKLICLLAGLLLSTSLWAAIDTYSFKSTEQEQQYRELTEQLRCPKCQNNSIADSNSMIAADMRAKVYQLMSQGQTRQQIIDYMVARYGHFVTYEPPVTASTLILWVGPALFVLVGGLVVVLRARRQARTAALSPQAQARLAQLLNDSDRTHD